MENQYPELTFLLSQRAAGDYRLELRFREPDSQSQVDPAAGHELVFKHDQAALELVAGDAAAYGRKLSELLFVDEVARTAYAQAQALAASAGLPLRVRLQIAPDALALHNLRWEALSDPEGQRPLFAGDRMLFSRYLSSAAWEKVRLRSKHELRALVAIANPSDLDVYGLEPVVVPDEITRARQALGSIQSDVLPENGLGQRVTLDAILARLGQEHYDILYIVAHGATRKDESYLWMENEQGETARVAGSELAEQLQKLDQPPLLVALLACQSAGDGASPALSAIGPRLAQAGIPAVLAMQGKISMESGAKFMPVFFQKLAVDGVLDQAVATARNSLRNQPDFWMPVLYTRLDQGLIFGEAEKVEVKPPVIQRLNRNLLLAIAALALLVIAVGGYIAWQSQQTVEKVTKGTPTPSRMSKDFNVAVAEFGVEAPDGSPVVSPDGSELANFMYERLNNNFSEIAGELIYEIWPPALVGKVEGATPEARRQAAQALAEAKNIHVLIYGVIKQKEGADSDYSPEFYINYQGFEQNAPDLLGGNRFGNALRVKNPFKRDAAAAGGNPALIARSEALNLITIGLAYYAFDDYETAHKYFSDAINLDKWTNSAGKEIAYLLRGNATSRLASINKDYSSLGEAEADYAQAWAITRQTYGRALLGLGGVRYLEALGDPNNLSPENIHQDILATAEATFEQALALPNQPESHNIPAKAHFSLGQSYLVRALVLGETEAAKRAQTEFDQVIQAYEGGSTTLQEIASFAYARLGLLEALVNQNLEESARRYQQAYDISSPYFKADNAQSLGRVYFDQGVQSVGAGDSILASQKFSLARRWLEDGIRLAESLGRQELIDDYQTLLDDLLAIYGQYLTPPPSPSPSP